MNSARHRQQIKRGKIERIFRIMQDNDISLDDLKDFAPDTMTAAKLLRKTKLGKHVTPFVKEVKAAKKISKAVVSIL